MTGLLEFDELEDLASQGGIDTVLVCLVDMQGRLMGKRFHVTNFLQSAYQETHCCNYLLATDLEMATPDGYASTSWQAGYGDYVMKPDLQTLRRIPWLEGTAMVLCDILDHHTHQPVLHSPRQMLKTQIARLDSLGFTAKMATELEFFLFEKPLDLLRQEGYRDLQPISDYNEDYHILQTTKEEHIMRPLRNQLVAAGVPVENSKGEAEAGQEELNIKYADALLCADHHTIAKQATKEIAWAKGHAASFLPKWHHERVGSAAHVHMSLWQNDKNAFYDPRGDHGMSAMMQHFMAGLIAHGADCTWFFAPYVNSYKRFAMGSFAPTKLAWSVDNRTAGFRLCGAGTQAVRVECRVPGSDINPYLTQAALLAAGITGLQNKASLSAPITGDVYKDDTAPDIPRNLRDAVDALQGSAMLRSAM
ncbi:MAG: glutamine synthetase family protein, partial [Pseudomonadota bacterium]